MKSCAKAYLGIMSNNGSRIDVCKQSDVPCCFFIWGFMLGCLLALCLLSGISTLGIIFVTWFNIWKLHSRYHAHEWRKDVSAVSWAHLYCSLLAFAKSMTSLQLVFAKADILILATWLYYICVEISLFPRDLQGTCAYVFSWPVLYLFLLLQYRSWEWSRRRISGCWVISHCPFLLIVTFVMFKGEVFHLLPNEIKI